MARWIQGAGWCVWLYTLAGCSAGMSSWKESLNDDDAVVHPEEEVEQSEPDDPDPEEEEQEDKLSAFEECFSDIIDPSNPGPDYDQFAPKVATHCDGTNHQDIRGVERVVFLGDSVTVGTPPSADSELYRNILADQLAQEFGLEHAGALWKAVNVFDGTAVFQESGDFASCAKWGARTDDLMEDNSQVQDCLPANERDKTTLVVMTIGGNDLASLTKGFQEGKPIADLWIQTESYMRLMRETVEWLKTPGRFPNGVYVIFSNLYEFTDGTGDTSSCPAANLAGFGAAVTDPALEEMVLWSMEQFMSISVDTRSDMLFLLENFCGHGYRRDDATGRCYRGPGAELWFDLTCTHPNPAGHAVIADMMMNVVKE